MKTTILAFAAAAALLSGGFGAAGAMTVGPMTAGAIPLAADAAPAVTLVSGGCGPAFHRGPYGGCRPNFRGGGYGYRRPFVRRGYGYGRPGFFR